MNNLEQVIQRAKRDIALKYVYVMMPIPRLQTLLDGLEESQKRVEELEAIVTAVKEELYAWKDAEHARACISTILPACKGAST